MTSGLSRMHTSWPGIDKSHAKSYHRLTICRRPHSGEAGPGSAGRLIENMIYYVYVLGSIDNDRLYIGITSDPTRRLEEHNTGKTKSTRPYIPYRIIYSESYLDKALALRRERQIKKSGKIRKKLKEGTYKGPIV